MAIEDQQKTQQKEAILENMMAIKYCLDFNKSDNVFFKQEERGCLGYPALILMCSVIDTIGSFFSGGLFEIEVDGVKEKIDKAMEHFYILNQTPLFNFGLSKTSIFDFYSCYRSTLTHNSALPENRFLKKGNSSSEIFEFDRDKKIHSISLIPLYNSLSKAVLHFIHWLEFGNWSSENRLKQDLKKKAKNHQSLSLDSLIDSGFTETKIFKIITS